MLPAFFAFAFAFITTRIDENDVAKDFRFFNDDVLFGFCANKTENYKHSELAFSFFSLLLLPFRSLLV